MTAGGVTPARPAGERGLHVGYVCRRQAPRVKHNEGNPRRQPGCSAILRLFPASAGARARI